MPSTAATPAGAVPVVPQKWTQHLDCQRVPEHLQQRSAPSTWKTSALKIWKCLSGKEILVVVDRISWGKAPAERVKDSLSTAFKMGNNRLAVVVLPGSSPPLPPEGSITTNSKPEASIEDQVPSPQHATLSTNDPSLGTNDSAPSTHPPALVTHHSSLITHHSVTHHSSLITHHSSINWFSSDLSCAACHTGEAIPPPTPNLFSFNSPLGACPECRGFGRTIGVDLDLVIPNPRLSLSEGAIKPWSTDRTEYLGFDGFLPSREDPHQCSLRTTGRRREAEDHRRQRRVLRRQRFL